MLLFKFIMYKIVNIWILVTLYFNWCSNLIMNINIIGMLFLILYKNNNYYSFIILFNINYEFYYLKVNIKRNVYLHFK